MAILNRLKITQDADLGVIVFPERLDWQEGLALNVGSTVLWAVTE